MPQLVPAIIQTHSSLDIAASVVLITQSETLQHALTQFRLLRLAFAHEFEADWAAEPFKGNLWHGLFGACLHEVSPPAYQALYGLDEAKRMWALIPPLSTEPWLPKHVPVQSGITLFGPAIEHVGAVMQALALMGKKGFGRDRVRAELLEVGALGLDDHPVGLHNPDAVVCGWDIWQQAQTAWQHEEPTAIDVHFLTPLRIKSNGEILSEPPTLEILIRRCLGRFVLLAPQLPNGVFGEGDQRQPLDLAAQCTALAADWVHPSWARRSARQQRTMPFEGLMGVVRYGAPASALLPWLNLAYWMQLGSKTSFGLGLLEAQPISENPCTLAGH